jgi:hypothetical protein
MKSAKIRLLLGGYGFDRKGWLKARWLGVWSGRVYGLPQESGGDRKENMQNHTSTLSGAQVRAKGPEASILGRWRGGLIAF